MPAGLSMDTWLRAVTVVVVQALIF